MEIGMLNLLGGIKIIKSELIPETETKPARIHKRGHKRIQKKWNKRYGFVTERPFIHTANTIYVHPNNIGMLLEKFK